MEGHPTTENEESAACGVHTDEARARNLFFAEVEHKVKTAMSVIQGWATTLDDRWDQMDEPRRREGVALIRKTSDRLVHQCEQLLNEARLGVMLEDLIPERVDLVEIASLVSEGNAIRGRVIECDSDGPVFAKAVPSAVQQILGHLVDNAEKYSPADTPVVVRVRQEQGMAVLQVIDGGLGVPEGDETHHLFEPFTRASDLAAEGTGLGLFIVRRLTEAMGGSVGACRNPKAGSTFTVSLPGAELAVL